MPRVTLTNAFLRERLLRHGHSPLPGRLHLLGVRGAVPVAGEGVVLELTENRLNRYDDTIAVFGTHLQAFRGSVDPGRTWTRKPSNPKGAAHLVNGAWDYQFGKHRGKPALVQAGSVTVRRDRDRDGEAEPGEPLDTGWFGLNLHAGGATPTVDAWSAGCQIIQGGWTGLPWATFYRLCKESGQDRFRYFLIDGKDLV